jgi:hypothetical protein
MVTADQPADQPAEEIGSDLIEFINHSFVIKIWLEETPEETNNPIWRGHITHVPSGERNYIQDLNGITNFLRHFLEKLGIKLSPIWLLRNRLGRWVRSCNGR